MDVISVTDGKNMGRICNVSFSFPEGKVLGITATGSRGFHWGKDEIFVPLGDIVRIGEDVVLVNFGKKPPDKPNDCPPNFGGRRNYDEYE